jgi:inhibitor of cysteine peptidase
MENQVKKQAIRYGIAAILLATILGAFIYSFGSVPTRYGSNVSPVPATHSSLLASFSSADALKNFLKTNSQNQGPFSLYGPVDAQIFGLRSSLAAETYSMGDSVQHSATNVQVAGVDEVDTVKIDDNGYAYVLSNDTVNILAAYPPNDATVLSKLKFNADDMVPIGIFVTGDHLAVLGSKYILPTYSFPNIFPFYRGPDVATVKTFVKVYDISDRSDPFLIEDFASTGSYLNSRMIGNYVYFVTGTAAYIANDAPILPEITTDGKVTQIAPTEIRYFNGTEQYYQYTTLVAMNIQNITEAPVYLPVMLGTASGMYVSQNNMYLTFHNWYWAGGNTTVYRIHLQTNNMTVEARGTIPGQEHNQFSMDENGNYFRVQTSTWVNGTSYTNVYVLDMNLAMIGKLENLAAGENFHSVRFIGDRCYLVTFMKTDPLFVIDLSNATNLRVLGELKIPGYSDYLHPYDETHLIGVGKNTGESGSNFGWYQGIKVSLFDVTNVTNPVQISNYTIGDRGSDTPVLYDPKAFLFDRAKNLLAIPATVAKIDTSKYPNPVPSWAYGDVVWQGVYVFNISTTHNLVLEGRITHMGNNTNVDDQGYWVKRSFYIENVLYTVSDRILKMNSLDNLSEIGQVPLS